MSLFKKKEKPTEQSSLQDLPELPQLPNLPEFPEANTQFKPVEMTSNLPELPSQSSIGPPTFHSNPPKSYTSFRSLPQYVPLIKEVSSGKEEVASDFQTNRIGVARGGKPRTLELGEEEIPSESIMREMPEPFIPRTAKSSSEPVFVRIDKYQAAVQAFNEIRSKLEEIESYLQEIKTLKQQEESDLAQWEAEIETIKARLNNIDQGVFGKLG